MNVERSPNFSLTFFFKYIQTLTSAVLTMASAMLKMKQCDDEEDWTKVSYNNARGKKRK